MQVLLDEMRVLKLVAFSGFGVSPFNSIAFEATTTIEGHFPLKITVCGMWLVSKISFLTE